MWIPQRSGQANVTALLCCRLLRSLTLCPATLHIVALYVCSNNSVNVCDDLLTQLKNICALLPSHDTDVRADGRILRTDIDVVVFVGSIRSCGVFIFFGVAKRAAEKITDTHAYAHAHSVSLCLTLTGSPRSVSIRGNARNTWNISDEWHPESMRWEKEIFKWQGKTRASGPSLQPSTRSIDFARVVRMPYIELYCRSLARLEESTTTECFWFFPFRRARAHIYTHAHTLLRIDTYMHTRHTPHCGCATWPPMLHCVRVFFHSLFNKSISAQKTTIW